MSKLYRCNRHGASWRCGACRHNVPHKCEDKNISGYCPVADEDVKCRIVRERDSHGRLIKSKEN